MKKMNIKGVFQIWMNNGDYHEVPLKECHAWTREGCKMCPDFAAEHADISTGGIGAFNDWTLTIVRTDIGRELMDGMIRDGWIETRPGDDDPGAIALMHKLSAKSRKRWPEFAIDAPRLLPTPDRVATPTRRRPGQQHQRTADEQERDPDDRHRDASLAPAPVNASVRVAAAPATVERTGGTRREPDGQRRARRRSPAGWPRTARTTPPPRSRWSSRCSAPACAW